MAHQNRYQPRLTPNRPINAGYSLTREWLLRCAKPKHPMPWIDPFEEAKAAQLEIESRPKPTIGEIAARFGRNPQAVT